MTATAIRKEAIEYINELPEEKLGNVITYLRNIGAKKNPVEVTTKEELYARLEEGLEDIRQGRVQPFDEAMREIRQELEQYGI